MNALRVVVSLLLVSVPAGRGMAQDPDATALQVREMIAAHGVASAEHAARLAGAAGAAPEERRELARRRPSAVPVIEKAESFIRDSPAHGAVPGVAKWLLEYQRSGARSFVYAALVEHHLSHGELGPAVLSAMFDVSEESSEFLRTVLDNAIDEQGRAAAAFVLGYRMRNAGEDRTDERLVYLRAAVKDVGDLEWQGRSVREVAEAHLYAAEHLAIGEVAPEIEGEDTEGVRFKLADYRGKVVLLEFWGHWGASCRGLYGYQRSLVSRRADQPFALLGVNSDPKTEVRAAMKEEDLPWRSFWDGGTTAGPIATRWAVTSWPTNYLLDANGVIRHKDLRGAALEEAVEKLVVEMAGEPKD